MDEFPTDSNPAQVLMALTEGGMQYFIAGARASVGMKALHFVPLHESLYQLIIKLSLKCRQKVAP